MASTKRKKERKRAREQERFVAQRDMRAHQFSLKELLPYFGILVVVGFIVFSKIFFNSFVWDDLHQIKDNQQTLIISNIPAMWTNGFDFTYRPVFFSTIAIINSLFGFTPFFYHALSVILHVANACLVLILFRKFFTQKVAFIASLFFLVHPMAVEPVANISFMMELWYVFFGLLSLLTLIVWQQSLVKRVFLAAVFLLLSIFSKESGLLFVPIILSYFAISKRKELIRVLSMSGGVVGIYLFMRLVVAKSSFVYTSLVPPYIPIQTATLAERLLTIPAITSYYLTTFFFPFNLVVQQYWIVKHITLQDFLLPLVIAIIFFGVIGYLAKVLSAKNIALFHTFLFFAVWFVVALGFHLQFFPLTMTVADRWFYVMLPAMIGMLTCLSTLIPLSIRKAFTSILIVILIVLSIRSLVRTYDWYDNYTLYSHDIQLSKDNFSMENDLGAELLLRGDMEGAKRHIERSIQLAPNWWLNWAALGNYYLYTGKYDEAEKHYKRAYRNSKSIVVMKIYATFLVGSDTPGSTASARRVAMDGLKYYPNDWNLWEILAYSDYQLGDKKKAIQAAKYAYALSHDPKYANLVSAFERGVSLQFEK